jgi:hypothetical protein
VYRSGRENPFNGHVQRMSPANFSSTSSYNLVRPKPLSIQSSSCRKPPAVVIPSSQANDQRQLEYTACTNSA